jgi:hypothetical protein
MNGVIRIKEEFSNVEFSVGITRLNDGPEGNKWRVHVAKPGDRGITEWYPTKDAAIDDMVPIMSDAIRLMLTTQHRRSTNAR